MSEIQRSKEYNDKTGKWEMMSFRQDKKGNVSVSPYKSSEKEKKGSTREAIQSQRSRLIKKIAAKVGSNLDSSGKINVRQARDIDAMRSSPESGKNVGVNRAEARKMQSKVYKDSQKN